MARRTWTPPPNWPAPPHPDWRPPAGWQPDPAWGPAPDGWDFYPGPARPAWWRHHWLHLVAACVLGIVIGGAVGEDGTTPPRNQSVQVAQVAGAAPAPSATSDATTVARLRESLAAARADAATARDAAAAARRAATTARRRLATVTAAERRALTARDDAQARARRAEAAAAAAASVSTPSSTSGSSSRTTTTVSCTRTSSGSCIQGGEFCRTADEGSYGYDANGRRYLCENRHWRVP